MPRCFVNELANCRELQSERRKSLRPCTGLYCEFADQEKLRKTLKYINPGEPMENPNLTPWFPQKTHGVGSDPIGSPGLRKFLEKHILLSGFNWTYCMQTSRMHTPWFLHYSLIYVLSDYTPVNEQLFFNRFDSGPTLPSCRRLPRDCAHQLCGMIMHMFNPLASRV